MKKKVLKRPVIVIRGVI